MCRGVVGAASAVLSYRSYIWVESDTGGLCVVSRAGAHVIRRAGSYDE